MMSKNKYKDFICDINKKRMYRMNLSLDGFEFINENISEDELKDIARIGNYYDGNNFIHYPNTEEELDGILKKYKNNPIIYATLLKSKIPEEIGIKLIDNLPFCYMGNVLNSEYTTLNMLKKAYERIKENKDIGLLKDMMQSQIKGHSAYISQKNIHNFFDLGLDILRELDYYPLALLEPNHNQIEYINAMLENENGIYFEDGVDEKFALAIANNIHLNDTIRNQAWEIAMIPVSIINATDKISEDVGNICIETLFSKENKNDKTKIHKKISDNELYKLIEKERLSDELQIDFYEQYLGDMYDVFDKTFELLLINTKITALIDAAIERVGISNRNELLSNKNTNEYQILKIFEKSLAIKKADKSIEPDMRKKFIELALKRKLPNRLYLQYLSENNPCIDYAIATSLYTPNEILEKVYGRNQEKEYYKELQYLKFIKNYLSHYFVKPTIIYQILDIVSGIFTYKDKSQSIEEKVKIEMIEKYFKESLEMINFPIMKDGIYLNEDDYRTLKNMISELKANYMFERNIEKIEKYTEERYSKSKLFNKHFYVFKHNSDSEFYDMPGIKMDVYRLCKYSEVSMQNLLKDLQEEENADILQSIQSGIQTVIADFNNFEIDKIYKYIYKLTDINNIINKKLEEKKKEQALELYFVDEKDER